MISTIKLCIYLKKVIIFPIFSTLYTVFGPRAAWLAELGVLSLAVGLWLVFYNRLVPLRMPNSASVKKSGSIKPTTGLSVVDAAMCDAAEDEKKANTRTNAGVDLTTDLNKGMTNKNMNKGMNKKKNRPTALQLEDAQSRDRLSNISTEDSLLDEEEEEEEGQELVAMGAENDEHLMDDANAADAVSLLGHVKLGTADAASIGKGVWAEHAQD